jgi:hypothetical protein
MNKHKLKKFFDLGHNLKIQEYSEREPSSPEILIHTFSKTSHDGYYTVWTTSTLTGIGEGGTCMSFDEIYLLVVDLINKTDYNVNNIWMSLKDKHLVDILENPKSNEHTVTSEVLYFQIEQNPYTHTVIDKNMEENRKKFLKDYKNNMELCKKICEEHSPLMQKVVSELMDLYDRVPNKTKIKIHKVLLDHNDIHDKVIFSCDNLTRNEFNTLVRMFWDANNLENFLLKIKKKLNF